MNGYHDLGEPVNGFDPLGVNASSFICAYQIDQENHVELFTVSDIGEPDGQFSWLHVTENEQVVIADLLTGSYEISGNMLVLHSDMDYISQYKEKSNPSSVPGAVQYKQSPDNPKQFSWACDASTNIVQIDERVYQSIQIVYNYILSKSSPTWIDQFTKMFLLGTMSAHCRIEGFGGAGMLQYLGKTTDFDGLLSGGFKLSSNGLREITTKFIYQDLSEIAGSVLNGEMKNTSNMSGSGKLSGIVHFEIKGTSQTWRGSVDYSKIEIEHTLPVSGEYLITIDNDTFSIDYSYGNPGNFDLTDIVNYVQDE